MANCCSTDESYEIESTTLTKKPTQQPIQPKIEEDTFEVKLQGEDDYLPMPEL